MRTLRQRRRRRGTRKQRGGVTWPAGIETSVWAHHLREDILHDKLVDISYADTTASPAGAEGGEGGTYKFLVDLAQADPNFSARKSKLLSFSINKGTESFQNWNSPRLYEAGNDRIGVVQDAGKFITGLLGAQNVVTFGHVLDPAGTPIDPKSKPILFLPPAGTRVDIQLQQFGFNPAIIPKISIGDFTAGTVTCTWDYNGRTLDAVAKRDVVAGTPLLPKQINNPRTENAGFFVSRADATGEGNLAGIADLRPYKIGKTLGDTLLVASAMQTFGGGVVNPFCGIGPVAQAGAWQGFGAGAPAVAPVPTILALKTGDRLNHLRAILKDVPSILEKPATAGRGRLFEFFPGNVDEALLLETLRASVAALPAEVDRRYTQLINQFRAAAPGGVLNADYAQFAAGNASLSGLGLRYGGEVFMMIADTLELLRLRIRGLFAAEDVAFKAREGDVPARMQEYQKLNEFVNRLAPPTAEILTNRGFVNQNIVIITAPSGGYSPGTPFEGIQPVKIMLHSIFTKIEQNRTRIARVVDGPAGPGGGGGADIVTALEPYFASTLFGEHFWQRTRSLRVDMNDQQGGVAEVVPAAEPNYDYEAFIEFINGLATGYRGTTGSRPIALSSILLERLDERAPLFMEFATFVGRSREETLGYVAYVNANRDTAPLYSTVVLDELLDEVRGVNAPGPDPVPATNSDATVETVMYNAFIFRKNADYAMDPGMTGEAMLDNLGFPVLSTALLGIVQPAPAVRGRPSFRNPMVSRRESARFTRINGRPSVDLRLSQLRQPIFGSSRRRTLRRRLRNKHLKTLHGPIETGV
jgi:hypothetical protein